MTAAPDHVRKFAGLLAAALYGHPLIEAVSFYMHADRLRIAISGPALAKAVGNDMAVWDCFVHFIDIPKDVKEAIECAQDVLAAMSQAVTVAPGSAQTLRGVLNEMKKATVQ